ncbi:MAG: 3'(2'),5'-bisphosphate nucleotidase CysQ [Bacteroidaceae bacterium]|nr:3'(2'),5'-bisphosphate nucleotidase CysQ [Bacteroidaceae bacterium]
MDNNHTQAGLGIAIRAALAAGRDIMQIYDDPAQDFGIERKADNSPLTLADKAAHSRIMSFLAETEIPVLSEEGAHEAYETRSGWHAFWLVDPLDGTKEFIKKNGEFTVNIALVLNGRPHLGVIYVPAQRVLYFADPLLGAYKLTDIDDWAENETLPQFVKRGVRMPIVSHMPEDPYVVVASRSHMSPETEAFIDDARKVHETVETRSSGSSLKICLVAEGVADAYPRFAPTMEWDTGAGHAIAVCAGCRVLQAGTELPLIYNKEDLHNPWFLVTRE